MVIRASRSRRNLREIAVRFVKNVRQAISVNFGLLGTAPPGPYREIFALLPGKSTVLVMTFLHPEYATAIHEMLSITRSLRFFPGQP